MAQDPVMSDEDFCTMIFTWTGVDLASRVGKKPKPEEKEPDNRPTIGELLVSGKNKDDFFTLAVDNQREVLKEWAKDCGFNIVKCGVIVSNAIKHYGNKSGM